MNIADIETLTRFLTNTDTTSLTAPELLILENKYYEQITGRIITETAGASWQYGDFNYTAFPTFTISMSDSVAQYGLDDINTAASTIPLTIMGVEVLDQDGNWHVLKRITLDEIHKTESGQLDYQKTDGLPNEYELRDNIIVLYPAPDNGDSVTLSNGLQIFYLRTADVFTSAQVSTGTKEPGFPSPWHDLMAYGPAYDVSLANKKFTEARFFKQEYDKRMDEMLKFISKRDQATRPVMSMKGINHI